MAAYQTVNRKQLIDYMTEHSGDSRSIDEWIENMKGGEAGPYVPGRSTVYRLMQRLVSEGLVIRSAPGNSRRAKYQIAKCGSRAAHLHLKCIVCGRLFHLSHETSELLVKSIYADQLFSVSGQTVIYGKCAGCR